MNNVIKASAYLILSGVLLGSLSCGSSGSGGGAGSGGTSGSGGASGTGGGACSGKEVQLTVKNFDVWCTFEINGANKSGAMSEQVCVPSNSTVKLSATADPGFVLGTSPWHDVDSQGANGSATVKVTSSSKCVWVCCPGTSGTPACTTVDQCP